MDKLVKPTRLIAFFLIIAALLAILGTSLYKLQIIEGAAYYQESRENGFTDEVVAAARGNLLDRYGRVLVSNRECYNLEIDTTKLFSDDVEDSNALILEMINIVESAGDTYIDEMPITETSPFEYVENMTEIQRTRLNAYFKDKDLDEDTTAVELMSYFRTRYEIDNNYTAEQMRIIAGIRYELNVRYAINTSAYVFVEDASIDLISTLMSQVGGIIEVKTSFVREYNTQYAAHLLGYIGLMDDYDYAKYKPQSENSNYGYDTKVGKDGVELAFEDELHGTDGKARVSRTSNGTVTSTVYTKEPIPGNHVYLTIDIQLQESVERILESGIITLQKKREQDNKDAIANGLLEDVKEDIETGAIVVVDVDSGEPLAIASYPTYNLATLEEDFDDLLSNESEPLFNRALMGAYAPGSTFKPATAIAALSEGVINTESRIKCQGWYTKYADQGYAPSCWIIDYDIFHGNDNVSEAIRDSCNYFFYSISDNLGITKMKEYAENFGLGVSTGIELTEVTGNMSNPDNHEQYAGKGWTYGDTLQAGIGQSDSLFTPLQLAEYCAAIANGGTRHSASILKGVRTYDYSTQLYKNESEVLSTVVTADYNWAAVQRGMELVASDVSSSIYQYLGNFYYNGQQIGIAAKTGTAQRGEGRTNNAIFICYAPADDPEIAISIVVERGGAGAALGSMAKSVLDSYFSISDTNKAIETENTILK